MDTLDASVDSLRVWVDLYFGSNKKSAPFRMVIDTGAFITWINKDV